MKWLSRARKSCKYSGPRCRVCARYGIGGAELFGSYARGDFSAQSDVDLAVEYTRPMTHREHSAFEAELEQALGMRVDVLDRHDLKPLIRARVEKEAIAL